MTRAPRVSYLRFSPDVGSCRSQRRRPGYVPSPGGGASLPPPHYCRLQMPHQRAAHICHRVGINDSWQDEVPSRCQTSTHVPSFRERPAQGKHEHQRAPDPEAAAVGVFESFPTFDLGLKKGVGPFPASLNVHKVERSLEMELGHRAARFSPAEPTRRRTHRRCCMRAASPCAEAPVEILPRSIQSRRSTHRCYCSFKQPMRIGGAKERRIPADSDPTSELATASNAHRFILAELHKNA